MIGGSPERFGERDLTLTIDEHDDDWAARGKCLGTKDLLFVEGAEQRRARALCMGCPVRLRCLAEALDNRIEWGVWGGMTERERRQLLRTRTEVTSWLEALQEVG